MKKKIWGFLATLVISALGILMVGSQPVSALGGGDCGTSGLPLGLRPWYDGLCSGSEIAEPSDQDDLVKFVWVIVLNVLFDLLLVSGYLAVGFIIWGGYLYIMAQGEPGRAFKGQKTLTSAIIGLVIVLSASVLVNTARVVLSINSQDTWQQDFTNESINNAFTWAYAVAGIVAVAFIVKGAITYLVSQGDPNKIRRASLTIIYAVVGLVIVLLAAAITNFILKGTDDAIDKSTEAHLIIDTNEVTG